MNHDSRFGESDGGDIESLYPEALSPYPRIVVQFKGFGRY